MTNKNKLQEELEEWKKIANGAICALRNKTDNWELEQLFEAYNRIKQTEKNNK